MMKLLSLFFIFALTPHPLKAQSFELGAITQTQGEATYFPFFPPFEVQTLKTQDKIKEKGSYLTQENAYFTMKLFDGSWVRISPKTKLTFEFDPTEKILVVHLYTGSLKILFSTQLNQNKIHKLMVKSSGLSFESVDGKFSVVRNLLTDETSVYVEKGAVVATRGNEDQKGMQPVHGQESLTLKDREQGLGTPLKLSEKEIKFLNSKFYLRDQRDEP
jgi:ferric-dicitrate binding protein FerR (iron transport regulator)